MNRIRLLAAAALLTAVSLGVPALLESDSAGPVTASLSMPAGPLRAGTADTADKADPSDTAGITAARADAAPQPQEQRDPDPDLHPRSQSQSTAAAPGSSATAHGPSAATAADDERLRSQIAGTWTLQHYGQRTITIKPDGTARMVVLLDVFSSLLYGRRLDLDIRWTIEDGVMTHTLIGGQPAGNVERLMQDFGDTRSYRIVEVTDAHMLLDEIGDDGDRHHWQAVNE